MAIEDENPSRVLDPPKDAKQPEIDKLLKDFRAYVEKPPPVVAEMGPHALVTNLTLAALLAPMAAEIKAIHGEVVNPVPVELLQQLRLDTAAAALKKSPIYEDHDQWVAYIATAVGGILVTLLAAGLVMRLGAAIINKLPVWITGPPPGAAPGLTKEEVLELRRALALTNPHLRNFASEIRRLPRARALAAQATAIDKLGGAIERLKVDDVRNATQALLRLKIIIRDLKPSNIPKSGEMRSTARAARSLNSAAGPLANSLTGLRDRLREVGSAATAAAGPIGT